MERLGQLAGDLEKLQPGSSYGPSVPGMMTPSPELKVLSALVVFLLVMLAGMEMQFGGVKDSFRARRNVDRNLRLLACRRDLEP